MENLGPRGPGLVAISGVSNASSSLRIKILPLARKLALLNFEDRKFVLKNQISLTSAICTYVGSLGSNVSLKNLDRTVSPFAMQLKYAQDLKLSSDHSNTEHKEEEDKKEHCEFENLGSTFKELGFCMMELGLRLARVCDLFIGRHELEESLLESRTAKGRLIHYHSILDYQILKHDTRKKEPNKKSQPASYIWQEWHYDYGIFTILTSPIFMSPCHQQTSNLNEFDSPIGHSYLQIFYPRKNVIIYVKSCPESLIVQVGESADLLSKGKLRSTLHSVCQKI